MALISMLTCTKKVHDKTHKSKLAPLTVNFAQFLLICVPKHKYVVNVS